jgi:hypothetical protein
MNNLRKQGFADFHRRSKQPPRTLGPLALALAALFTSYQGKATEPGAESGTSAPLAEEFKPLQGHWEGEGSGGKCSITIAGNSLRYTNASGWFKTTFTLPKGTDPKQLHATIQECSPPSKNAVGTVVFAIFKIEDEALTLADYFEPDGPPKSFESAMSRYVVQKVQPEKKDTKPPKTK